MTSGRPSWHDVELGAARDCLEHHRDLNFARRFAYCGWRKAYPKLDKFNETMLERPLCKVSLPLKS
jgi:hypothetical protein